MKYTIFLAILVLSSQIGQAQQKTGWVPTGKTQVWHVTIHKDTLAKAKLLRVSNPQGYAKFAEFRWVPDPSRPYPGWEDPKPNQYFPEGTVYNSAMKKLDAHKDKISGMEWMQPKTTKLKRL